MTHPDLAITYFDVDGGRGEAARLALFIGGIPFKDDRLAFPEFGARKSSFPFGKIPTLTVDGVEIAESVGINRYVATLAGLYPADPIEGLRCDEILSAAEDMSNLIGPSMRMPDGEAKQAAREALVANDYPRVFAQLARRLGDNQWFVGETMTIADIRVFVFLRAFAFGAFDHIPTDLVPRLAPTLAAHSERVMAHPKIREYYAARHS